MSTTRILYIFTRTPLHVGAGASVGAIDQPIVRERHTGFPIIPGTSLKGTFADAWNEELHEQDGRRHLRVTTRRTADNKEELDKISDAAWLFGSDNASHSFSGALQFSEARLLAFPVRSAKGSFAWITCPLILQRATRDGVVAAALLEKLGEPKDNEAVFDSGGGAKLALGDRVVLEEYTFTSKPWLGLMKLGQFVAGLFPAEPVWAEVKDRLVVLSNGMMSFFVTNACEIAQHVRIDDETGTAAGGALFNQENVPSETMFYSVLNAVQERSAGPPAQRRSAATALEAFVAKANGNVFQFGGDASTGLGYCTLKVR